MTSISVDDDVRDELLRISAGLQLKLGRRVSYSDAIRFLIESRARWPELIDNAVVEGARRKGLLSEL